MWSKIGNFGLFLGVYFGLTLIEGLLISLVWNGIMVLTGVNLPTISQLVGTLVRFLSILIFEGLPNPKDFMAIYHIGDTEEENDA